jgi:prevent-host-death family protein
MITEVSDIHLRQNLGALLNQVEDRKDSILISKDGKPVAALVDADLFARINRIRDRFEDLANRIAEDYAQTPVEIGLAEIDAAVAAQRAQ